VYGVKTDGTANANVFDIIIYDRKMVSEEGGRDGARTYIT
jgi:hypothetical protein